MKTLVVIIMKNLILISSAFLLFSCNTSNKFINATMTFKNYQDIYSPFINLNDLKNTEIYRFGLYESKSIDKVIIINWNEEINSFTTKIIDFGIVFKNKKEKQVFNIIEVKPINGYENLIKELNLYFQNENSNYENNELIIHEPILNYTLEYKSSQNQTLHSTISVPKSYVNQSIKGLKLIEFIKSEFNIN